MRYITVVISVCALLALPIPAEGRTRHLSPLSGPYEAPVADARAEWRVEQVLARLNYERTSFPSLPDPPPAHRGMGNQTTDVERWRPLVAKYFAWEDVDRALCLMGYESGGNPSAQNPTSTATGLMQIMHSVWRETFGVTDRSEWHDPELNIYAASVIRSTQGWTAWAPYNRGLCR